LLTSPKGITVPFFRYQGAFMADKVFDVVVVGGGPGGYTAAIRAAQLKMKTAIVERERLGGICLNWGCVPTKALLKNAEIFQLFRSAGEWGITCENLNFDFAKIIKRSRGIADRVSKGVEYLMKKNAIEHYPGVAALVGGGRVEVRAEAKSSQQLHARRIIIATGARPRSIPHVAIDKRRIITSTEAMTLSALPTTMLVIGGGPIGVEFAYFYNALGTKVTIIEMMPGILPMEDRELTKLLETSLRRQGIEILTGTTVDGVKAGASDVTVGINGIDGRKEIKGDLALMAIGVQGNVEHLGLDQLGVAVEGGVITVDKDYRTNVEGIYAIGDVIGPPWLAHVASAEGIHCAEAIAGLQPEPLDYSSIPGCTYCKPQLASVGLTEEKAMAQGHEIRVGRFPFRPLGKAAAIGETEGIVKLVFDAKYGELLGAHILGADATELIAELVLAKKLEATGKDIYHAVHAHPTLSEAVMEAAAAAYNEAINI
jgi:dihydrolipoamide dehydrogenase